MMVFERVKLIVLSVFMFAMASSLATQNFPLAKPKCIDTCGDIRIPFPFGTTKECYLAREFWVTCNPTTSKLFWMETDIEITDLSLDGHLKLLQFKAKNCYENGQSYIRNSPSLQFTNFTNYFTVSNTANKFTIVGCDAYGYVSGRRLNRSFTTGCTAMCSSLDDLTEGQCAGAGCCQTIIPDNVWNLEVEVGSYSNYSGISNFSSCSYAFFAEDTAFKFSKDNLTNLFNVTKLPMVVDWSIGNETCEKATDYACLSAHSVCYNHKNGNGYNCNCSDGFKGNPYLTDGCIDIDECTDKTHDCTKSEYCHNTQGNYTCSCPKKYDGDGRGEYGCSKKQNIKIASISIVVAGGIIALLLAVILLFLELKRRSQKKTKSKFFLQNGGHVLQEKLARREASPEMITIFSSSKLQMATNNFHSSMIIGRGGFGTVYRGVLADRRTVAIKRSIRVDPTQIEQFINEVVVLSQINHRNVVTLLGCCLETDTPLLVYEFISNGTLSSHLHNEAKARVLDWKMRLKIAAETAGVLSYLHSSASTPIIHRDVKSDNILLDHNFTAKVSDFGSSKLVPVDLAQLSTIVQGTFGYLDPEYMQTNQLTEKSDVYSFGVVLLELITGRRALSLDRPVEEKSLANYFLLVLKQNKLFEIVDDNIVCMGNTEQISAVAKLAKECLNVKGENRPSMKEVAMELEGLMLGGKHSWERDAVDIEEEAVSLLPIDYNGMSGVSSSSGYDSICRDHIVLPIDGGR